MTDHQKKPVPRHCEKRTGHSSLRGTKQSREKARWIASYLAMTWYRQLSTLNSQLKKNDSHPSNRHNRR
jgi:hypothetical protein